MSFEFFSYQMPTKIVYGRGRVKEVGHFIKGRKALLVTSAGSVERGLVDLILSCTSNIVKVFSNVKSHPDFYDLKCMYDEVREADFDVILAVGGGSVIDAAKFVSVGNERRDYKFVEDLTKGKIPKKNYTLCPIISVPTTAGTSSEITPFSTVWDMVEKKKYSLYLDDLFSEVAIYDPVLTLSVPKVITIQTGLDTLSHALESIWNKNASPITVRYAIKSAKLILDNLVDLVADLDNVDYRDSVMKACMYAGLAFSNTQTAAAHAISYYITIHKKVDHGIACSFTLPALIDDVVGKYGFVDDALMEIFGELSSSRLRDLLSKLSVSTDYIDYGISDDELERMRVSIDESRSNNSLASFC